MDDEKAVVLGRQEHGIVNRVQYNLKPAVVRE